MRASCKALCTTESKCVSINISPAINDKVLCQLSDSDYIRHTNDLKPRAGYIYRGTENFCSSNPCVHNATCLNGFTDKKYLCLCQMGFIGEQCEKDINECDNGMNDCHVNANCTNTLGSFVCTCKAGYAGDGQKCSAVAGSCKELLDLNMSSGNKAYPLKLGSSLELDVYCHMTNDLGACGGSGWTLVMKIDGNKETFHYDSNLWSDKKIHNPEGGETGFDMQETKLPTYWDTSFSKVCLGMKIPGKKTTNFISINKKADSLYSLISDGQFSSTSVDRDTWKALLGSIDNLQSHCNREGFNAYCGGLKARIGILGNNENDCNTCDSFIGFGTKDVTNSGPCGDRHTRVVGYILIQ